VAARSYEKRAKAFCVSPLLSTHDFKHVIQAWYACTTICILPPLTALTSVELRMHSSDLALSAIAISDFILVLHVELDAAVGDRRLT
jgi:hypothetical protein